MPKIINVVKFNRILKVGTKLLNEIVKVFNALKKIYFDGVRIF